MKGGGHVDLSMAGLVCASNSVRQKRENIRVDLIGQRRA